MSLVINTNVASLNSQRQLMNSGGALDKATERLSSGQRINSAKDDAAGLAISNRMTSQVRGLDQAIRNANDGVSLIQTAEGALQETTNILQRMRELSIQAGNGIYTDADRKTLDAEVQQLTAELNRIATSTSFNGQKLLDGTLGKVNLQVGADANQTITMKIPKMDAKTLGMGSTSGDVAGAHLSQSISKTKFNDGDILINGKSIGAFDGTKVPPDTFEKLLANINEKVEGISASAFNEVTTTTVGTGVTTTAADLKITLTNPDNTVSQITINNTNTVDELVEAINVKSGGLLVATKTENGLITLANANGATIDISGTGNTDAILGKITTPSFGQISLTAKNGQDIVITQGPNAQQPTLVNGLAMPAGGITAGTLKINGVDISVADKPEFVGANFPAAALVGGDAGNVVIGNKTYALVATNTINTLVNLINADTAITGIRAENGGSANGNLQLYNATGTPMVISGTAATLTATGLVAGTYVDQAEITGAGLPSATVGTIGAGTFTVNGTTITMTASDTIANVITAINAQKAITGVTAVNGGGANGSLKLFDDAGAPITIAGGDPLLASIGLTAGTFSTPSADLAATIAAINAQTLNTGVTASNGGLSERGSLLLTDAKGRDVNISGSSPALLTSLGLSEGSTVAPSLLDALGFQETRKGATVFGQHIPAANSTKALAFGDLSINGVTISGENTLTLQGKVNNINAKSSDTGVIASLKAESVSTTNELKLTTEVTGTTYGPAVAGNIVLNGVSVAIAGADPLSTSIAKINAAFSSTGVLAYQDSTNKLHLYSEGQINIGQTSTTAVSLGLTVGLNAPSVGASGSIRLNNTQISFSNIADLSSVMSSINAEQANTGVYASLNDQGQLVLNSNSAFSIDTGDVNGGKTLANLGLDATLAGPMGVVPAAAESLTTIDMANTSAELTGGVPGAIFAANDSISINGLDIPLTPASMAGAVASINAQTATTGVVSYLDTIGKIHMFADVPIVIASGSVNGAAVLTALNVAVGTTSLTAGTTGSIRLNGTAISLTNIGDINTTLNQINAQQATTGVYASLSKTGQLSLKSAAAILIGPGDVNGGKTLANLGFNITATGPIVVPATVAPVPGPGLSTNVLASIELNALNDTPISVSVTANGTAVTGLISQNQESSGSGFGSSIGSISIATQAGAQKAIKIIDIALDTINDVRSQLGAINNRLEFTVNNLANVSEKTSTSRSRIVDADFAAETAAMSRAQVLQQAATAMLAQSNARPKEVLSLLR